MTIPRSRDDRRSIAWHHHCVSPHVTVIIPTYNRSEVLGCAIRSVLGQTYGDYELIVAGDGCTDDSEGVVAAFADPRVRWMNLPRNTGHQSAPNNAALQAARGALIAYLGHDDLWLPHHLAAHVEAFAATATDLTYSLCVLVAADGTAWPTFPNRRNTAFAPPTGMMHRRAVLDEIGGWREYQSLDERRDGSPDVELWRRAKRAGKTFTFVPRLTGVKFPAAWRRDVHVKRSSDEQRQWLARIETEPNLEATLLAHWIGSDHIPTAMPFGDLLRFVAQQVGSRFRRRLSLPSSYRTIEENRRFKGLPK
jgi:glycosyltransferase involved in cell wall biosynthesis